jgi:hypothetical protein
MTTAASASSTGALAGVAAIAHTPIAQSTTQACDTRIAP